MRNKLKAGLTVSLAGAMIALSGGIAQAETISDGNGTSIVQQATGTGNTWCQAEVYLSDTSAPPLNIDPNGNYATGLFVNASSGFSCAFWLQKATYDYATKTTGPYTPIGSWATNKTVLLSGQDSHFTGAYSDGAGWRVEACFYMYNSTWQGATHCSHGV